MQRDHYDRIQEAAGFVAKRISVEPAVGLVLGSGLGGLAEDMDDGIRIPFETIPHFPRSTVEGHAGRLVAGHLSGLPVLVMQGRFHYYEGYSLEEVVFPVRMMKRLGVRVLLVTNAAGGVNPLYVPGDLMIIADHLNLLMQNPLAGWNDERLGPRFPDMTEAYDRELRALLHAAGVKTGIALREGVYAALPGPSYETPAEIRMLRLLGADAVGMSTVPEVIAARHAGLRVAGISCISNMAAGIQGRPLSHQEVIETGKRVQAVFASLIRQFLRELSVVVG
jgi:purine-nucleoside phosphorylase